MFVFGGQAGSEFVLVRGRDRVYTYPSETLARECFEGVKAHSHLYQVDNDLSVARLVEAGDPSEAPKEVELTEKQKLALWSSYAFKSLLAWCPYPD